MADASVVSVAYVRSYAKLDPDEPEEKVRAEIDTAEAYLRGAGVLPHLVETSLYQLCVAGIVLDWHDHRSATKEAPKDFSTGTRMILNQLKLTCVSVSNLDTGG